MTEARATAMIAAGLAALLSAGCLDEQRFVTPEAGGPFVFAIDEDTPPYFESEDGNVYLVEQRVLIPFREPTAEEQAALSDIGDAQIPYPQLPYVRRGDIEVQVDFTLSYLDVSEDAGRVSAAVTLNGINEFHEYDPQVQIIDDELVVDFSGWERNYILQPGERVSGTVREEEIDEIAVDLASVVNGAPNANQIVYFENQSAQDTRSQMYIPDVVPALTGVRVGLRVAGDEPVPLVLELTVRVRDLRDVLVQGDDEPWVAPTPALFGPMDAAAAAGPMP